ncbi:hypothetical protein CSQ79_22710 [Gloeocapsopsis sp. IPPAS B-1203]|nr:hypothetical protein CSQ79_22710 [Gloeocapsopsis sp. IPPAS B-1203]
MSQSLNPIRYEWKDIPWKQTQVKVFKLQRRIYRASQSGDVKRVHRLQRLLMKSWYAKCLAVRRVTQDNQGKKTAGVDGIKSLTPAQRFKLIGSMDFKSKSRAVRRVWIPKPGKAEKRPLGIYWLVESEGWKFSDGDLKLLRHAETSIHRHTKVKGTTSPYDGKWTYWSKRRGTYPGISTRVSTAIKRQKGKSAECGLHFHMDDAIEIHHINGNHRNIKMENLTAIHRHCHDRIHGGNGNLSTLLSTHVKGQSGEEPDERKLSRPVLKPSMGGDLHA